MIIWDREHREIGLTRAKALRQKQWALQRKSKESRVATVYGMGTPEAGRQQAQITRGLGRFWREVGFYSELMGNYT